MSTAKLKVQYSGMSFEGEGDPAWISEQLENFLSRIESNKLPIIPPLGASQMPSTGLPNGGPSTGIAVGSLASFLNAKGASNNQVKKFLVTSEWVHQKGQKIITTGGVNKALKDYHQSRLGNPSDCLSANIGKGYCERTDGGFYVTPEGRATLGTIEPVANPNENDLPAPEAANSTEQN